MVLGAAAAATAAASTGSTLFSYNRENFLYDRKQRQETEYAILEFRLKQAELWREDVRDIIGLTSVKMDTYLIVTAVQLGFCVMAFCEGRLQAGTPTWLIGSHTLSLVGAFLYFLMAIWLAMHATISAKSYEVRLLTQLVRLPVPSWTQLEGARTYASQFEQTQGRQMFRVPFVMGSQESVMDATRPATSSGVTAAQRAQAAAAGVSLPADAEEEEPPTEAVDPWGMERTGVTIPELDSTTRADPRQLRHVQIVSQVVQYWQAYDAFARVSMSMGTNQLVTALAYYVLGYVLISNHSPVAAWSALLLFIAVKLALIRLDMSLTACEFATVLVLVASGPVLAAVAAQQWSLHTEQGDLVVACLSPVTYLMHSTWLVYLLYICGVAKQPGGAMLPTRFRSVLYLDVFGWIKRKAATTRIPFKANAAAVAPPVAGDGPALQVTQYDHGTPVPARPEDLPSSQKPAKSVGDISREHLDPSSFVPKPKGWNSKKEKEEVNYNPGMAPWRIFWWATATLAFLWMVSGTFTLLSSLGFTFMQVYPLLREGFHDELAQVEDPDYGVEPGGGHLIQSQSRLKEGGKTWWSAVMLQSKQEEHLHGQAIATHWPHANMRPLGLACNGDAGVAVTTTRFGLFSASLPGTSSSQVEFALRKCSGLQGEGLQDVNLDCSGSEAGGPACEALILHRQGTRVTPCGIQSQGFNSSGLLLEQDAAAVNRLAAADIGADWLEVPVGAEGPEAHEEVASTAYRHNCSSNQDCLYLETTSGRIVELRRGPSSPSEQQWLPRHILHREEDSDHQRLPHGALHTLKEKYIAVLRGSTAGSGQDQQFVEVLDPDASAGIVIARWSLPRSEHWGAMCAAGDSLYLLPKGPSPQLWQFRYPNLDSVAPQAQKADTPPASEVPQEAKLLQETSTVGTSHLRHQNRQQQMKLQVEGRILRATPW
mmetsp:Transcript_37748/g.87229  ORF Transcript_37748/g.87229 Transcript_37748/m.87229 type:complete len:937 (-) Transcript_37748:68-2878(-)